MWILIVFAHVKHPHVLVDCEDNIPTGITWLVWMIFANNCYYTLLLDIQVEMSLLQKLNNISRKLCSFFLYIKQTKTVMQFDVLDRILDLVKSWVQKYSLRLFVHKDRVWNLNVIAGDVHWPRIMWFLKWPIFILLAVLILDVSQCCYRALLDRDFVLFTRNFTAARCEHVLAWMQISNK